MKTRFTYLLTLILGISLLLAACGGQPTAAPVAQETAAPEVVVEEPQAEPIQTQETVVEAPQPASEADLDAAFTAFLSDMEAYNAVSLESLNEMMAGSTPYLLDVREVSELEESGYIEGAVNLPLREVLNNIEALPALDEPIVSYCGSGWRCTIAMTVLEGLGYDNVLSLKGDSYSGWVEAGYPIVEGLPPEPSALNEASPDVGLLTVLNQTLENIPEGFGGLTAEALNTELAENPDLILIDVRRLEELEESGAIDASSVTNIPLEQFVEMKGEWPVDKDAPIVVYCGSGHRSTIAMTMLWSYGYTDVRSLKGGYSAWAVAGYPTVGGMQAPDLDTAYITFLADMESYNTISLEALNEMMAETAPYLLDVREASELEESGYIEGAVNLPLREVLDNVEVLPAFDTPIVSYCGSGWRCTIAMTVLEGLGYEDVLSLKGGSYSGWVEAGYPFVEGLPPEPEVIDAVTPDPALLAVFGQTLANVPEGFGGITAEALNTELAENPDLILIDVRQAGELEENGLIDAANVIHIPLEEFIEMQAEWPADMDAPIVVYCGSGHRSTIAMTMLWSFGYSDVRSLKDGFSGWAEAGYPVADFSPADS